MNDMSVFHERIKLPLFHVHYNLLVSDSTEAMARLVEQLFPGIKLDINDEVLGYTALIKHFKLGEQLLILINTRVRDEGDPTLMATIIHEATHLSWYIMDYLGIDVDSDNNEVQCYLMEELFSKIYNFINKEKEIKQDNNIDEL